jgi:hypothetical protein
MVGRLNHRQAWLVALALVSVWSIPLSLLAQGSSGMASGVVKDAKGTPVDGATVVLQSADSNRKIEVKTNKKGEHFQLGLPPGNYTPHCNQRRPRFGLTPSRIQADQTLKSELVILDKKAAAAASAVGREARPRPPKSRPSRPFSTRASPQGAGRHDEAIAKFTEAAGLSATCYDCFNNIGFMHVQKKEYDKAEAAQL